MPNRLVSKRGECDGESVALHSIRLCPPLLISAAGAVPSQVDPWALVGQTVHVYWPDDLMFYEGKVGAYKPRTFKHEVRPTGTQPRPPPPRTALTEAGASSQVNYFDGQKETIHLAQQRLKLQRKCAVDKCGAPLPRTAYPDPWSQTPQKPTPQPKATKVGFQRNSTRGAAGSEGRERERGVVFRRYDQTQ
jgi:hypothetical protein